MGNAIKASLTRRNLLFLYGYFREKKTHAVFVLMLYPNNYMKPINTRYGRNEQPFNVKTCGRVRMKPDGTRWRTGGEVKGKLANGVGSQYSHTTSERGVYSITTADANTSAASSRLNWSPRRFKWTRPFRRKTKSGFCACAITFQTQSTLSSS